MFFVLLFVCLFVFSSHQINLNEIYLFSNITYWSTAKPCRSNNINYMHAKDYTENTFTKYTVCICCSKVWFNDTDFCSSKKINNHIYLCVCVCVRACVRACVRVCVCVWCFSLLTSPVTQNHGLNSGVLLQCLPCFAFVSVKRKYCCT